MYKHVKKGEAKVMPWKNGLGVTAEYAKYFTNQSTNDPAIDYFYRMSRASLRLGKTKFSSFPNYTRYLCLLKPLNGNSKLEIQDTHGNIQSSQGPNQIMKFQGDVQMEGELKGGDSGEDWNLFVKNGMGIQAQVDYVSEIQRERECGLLFAVGKAKILISQEGIILDQDDALQFNNLKTGKISLLEGGPLICVNWLHTV
ncbi:hypothetical protein FGO68_gene225 [Halteria grandinella]|uniref:Uncharacterized protein n=1 Tax=Halteria grandinella TaxID=5974 RepID=A0A8J8SYN9_HALGN|nr:hypothetical protein FGO68_gene225 [Halteria grandinella]